MAATKYEVYCRAINSVSNMAITNTEAKTWVSCFKCKDTTDYDDKNAFTKETMIINNDGKKDMECNDAIIKSLNTFQNEKYNMLFVYAGREIYYDSSSKSSSTGGTGAGGAAGSIPMPYLVTDKFERIFVSPWFIHSTHASLNSAMSKAEALVKKVGLDNVKIGKYVDLEQYLDIV